MQFYLELYLTQSRYALTKLFVIKMFLDLTQCYTPRNVILHKPYFFTPNFAS